MNPLTKVKLINELNEREADLGVNESVSWHSEYRDSAWIFVGGFPYELTEGDLLCVFSQYGEIVNINLVRDKKTGKSKGFCFICYEDQRSTILAVDNFNGIKIKGRTIRVDHVKNYRPPKDGEDIDDVTKRLREDGCAPTGPAAPTFTSEEDEQPVTPVKKPKKDKKEKKKKEKKRSRPSSSPPPPPIRVKEEKQDSAYEKYASGRAQNGHNETERRREEKRGGRRDERRREVEGEREDRREERRREVEGEREDRREERRREVEGEREDRREERRREADRERSRR